MSSNRNLSEILSLLEIAVDSSSEGITIGTMAEEDRPLVYANRGFERLTGYSISEVLGKNCRFLQGEDTEQAPVDEIRRAIANGEETTVELLNYRKDGTPFWNRLSITPLKDEHGVVTHYVGIQSDITELKETKRELEAANKELESFRDIINLELDQASKAQQFILPPSHIENDSIIFSAFYAPMSQIGGDYYDFVKVGDSTYGMLIADVTGHGIPAALLTLMTSYAFKESSIGQLSSEAVIKRTNKKLQNKMPSGAFITMFYALYDSVEQVLTYTQAGHPKGYVLRPSTKELIHLQTEGSLVGVFNNSVVTYSEKKIALKPGDKLVLYTDAIIEVKDNEDNMITSTELEQFMLEHIDNPLDKLFEGLYQFGCDFSGQSTYNDDFTLIGFEVKE